MVFLLTSVYELARSRFAFKAQIGEPGHTRTVLVDANGTRLNAWNADLALDPDTRVTAPPYLSMNHALDLKSEIKALEPFQNHQKELVVAVLLGCQLRLLEVLPSAFIPLLTVPFLVVSGHLDSLEVDPILISCSNGDHTYLVVYKYTGFVTLFNVDLLLAGKLHAAPNKRSRKSLLSCNTFAIGNVVVSLMAVLHNKGPPTIAVLYRDIDFNYSQRYYSFDVGLTSFSMDQQMDHFSGAPSLVTAVSGGFLVASDLKLWYFAGSGKTALVADLVGDTTCPVSRNKLHNCVTLNMSAYKTRLLGSPFETSTQIDDNRHLFISDRGTTVLVYLDAKVSGATVTVVQFQVVVLGKTTVASDLVHLEDNVFYAGSLQSRLVLFRILPQAPYIDILSCVTDSSPILNMDLQTKNNRNMLLLSRGGFHSGELEVVTDSMYKVDRRHLRRVKNEASYFTLAKSAGPDLVNLQDDSGKMVEVVEYPSFETSTAVVGQTRQTLDSMIHSEDEYCYSWKIDDLRSIEFVEENEHAQFTLHSHEKRLTVPVERFDEISCLEWREKGEILEVYVALWKGTLAHLLFTANSATVIGDVSTGLQGKISFLRFSWSDSCYLIVLLDSEGLVFQVPVSTNRHNDHRSVWDLKHSQHLKAKQNSGTFRMRHTPSHGVLVHDDSSVYLLKRTPGDSAVLALTKVHSFRYRIVTCQLAEASDDAGTFIVLFDDGTLSQYLFQNRQGVNDSYSSKHLILLSCAVSDRHTVALQVEYTPNSSTGEMDTVPSLLLFDLHSLKLFHEYKPRDPCKFVDMCLVDGKYTRGRENYIVVANCVDDPRAILKVYRVALDKIEPVSGISVRGQVPQKASISKIACHKNTLALTGSNFTTFTLATTDDAKQEFWKSEILEDDGTPFFGASVAGNDAFWVLADAVRGLFVSFSYGSRLIGYDSPFLCTFATAVAALKTAPVFIYGDAAGNIWGARKRDGLPVLELLFHSSVHEMVNHILVVLEAPIIFICATVNGNVYRVQNLSGYPLVQLYLVNDGEESPVYEEILNAEHGAISQCGPMVIDGRVPSLFSCDRHELGDMPLQIELAKLICDSKLLCA